MPNSDSALVTWYEVMKDTLSGRIECTRYAHYSAVEQTYVDLLNGCKRQKARDLLQFTDSIGNNLHSRYELARKFFVFFDDLGGIDTFITVIVRRTSIRGLPGLTLRLYILTQQSSQMYLDISEVLLRDSETFMREMRRISRHLGIPYRDNKGRETLDPLAAYATSFLWPQFV